MEPVAPPKILASTPGAADRAAEELAAEIERQGYAFVPATRMRPFLGQAGTLDDWPEFAQSWDGMPVDEFMADHGRYRRRRHAVFSIARNAQPVRAPHQPHYQSREYNALNGGVERWFEPMPAQLADGPSLHSILARCRLLFDRLSGARRPWHVEVHQFRIEAVDGQAGQPTPEGMHRDGVDYVLVLLVRRQNVDSGTTLIGAPGDSSGKIVPSCSFTLTEPFDAAWVDDHRAYHAVTPVTAFDQTQPAFRDVLVVTFRRA